MKTINIFLTIIGFCITVNVYGQTNAFETKWEVSASDLDITIPTAGNGFNYTVDWGDGSMSTGQTGNASHTYTSAGIYTVKITGDFPQIYFNFHGDRSKIKEVSQWGDIAWSSMKSAFAGCTNLDVTATDTPDLSGVSNMSEMFIGCSSLIGTSAFNSWDVSTATDMGDMFNAASIFNQDIGNWNVSNVENMAWMFVAAYAFNQDIGSWNVSNVESMSAMFLLADAFDQNLGSWDLSSITTVGVIFQSTGSGFGLSTVNYDQTLIGWGTDSSGVAGDGDDDVPQNILLGANYLTYCIGESTRQDLIDTYSWTINDAGVSNDCAPFETKWQTTLANESITIPVNSAETYNYTVDWGDGSVTVDQTGNATHTYSTAGTYTVRLTGEFPQIYFNNSGDKLKITAVSQWGDIVWSSMGNAFYGCSNLNVTATDSPDLSLVTSALNMFRNCSSLLGSSAFNNWEVSSIENMNNLFLGCASFNQDLNGWNVSSVNNMKGMFYNATAFNGDISNWNVDNVTTMQLMFYATAFDQDISAWNTVNVSNMNRMFNGASAFDQDLGSWDISKVTNAANMFAGTALSTANYDSLLIGWNTDSSGTVDDDDDDIPSNLAFGAPGIGYCLGEEARTTLINSHSWTITDAGLSTTCMTPFETKWQTTSANETIAIPTFSGETYNYTVDWGDGTLSISQTGNVTHSYAVPGNYTVRITGVFPRIYFAFTSGQSKLTEVSQWGDITWSSMAYAFYNCDNLDVTATDTPDLSQATDPSYMFYLCESLVGTSAFGSWDMSNVQKTAFMFDGASVFNVDIGSWNMSNVEDMSGMFNFTDNFNADISSWNVSNVEDMSEMFSNTDAFNVDISSWTVNNVTDMSYMFENADAFNSDISSWNVSNVENMRKMFQYANIFNVDISSWNVSKVTNMSGMFQLAVAFNQDLGSWDISGLSNASNMLNNCGLSTENYDSLLSGWSTLDTGETSIPNNIALDASGISYCLGEDARTELINIYGWTINDAGQSSSCTRPFKTKWVVPVTGDPSSGLSITIPTVGSGYNYTVDWGDNSTPATGQTGDATHTYTTAGTYEVSITGTFPRIYFHYGRTNAYKIIEVSQWGDIAWSSMGYAFAGCGDLDVTATDTPDLSSVTDLSYMFHACDLVGNSAFSSWNTSTITDMTAMFGSAKDFNQNIGSWNVSSVTDMSFMFYSAEDFNQDLGNWDISSLTDASNMLDDSGLSAANYDNLLIGWSTLDTGETAIPSNITLGASGIEYCNAATERATLTGTYSWTIGDAGLQLGCDSGGRYFGPLDDDNPIADEGETLKAMFIYPNPTKGLLYLSGDLGQIQHISIYNVMGQLVKQTDSAFDILDLSHLVSGMYLVKIYGKDHQIVSRSIIKR